MCAAISAAEHESPISDRGGMLIDLGHCGRADDQWAVWQPMLGYERGAGIPIASIRGEVADGEARVVVEGGPPGIAIRSVFALDEREPEVLRVTTELTRGDGGDALIAYSDIAFHATSQLRPFSLLRRAPERSVGFAHPAGDLADPLSMVDAMTAADAYVLVGGERLPGLAYGIELRDARLVRADGTESSSPTIALTLTDVTVLGAFSRPFWFGDGDPVGLLEFAQAPFLDLEPGDRLVLERAIRLGRRADVASVADAWYADGVAVEGRVDDPAARVHFALASGAPLSEVRPDADGRFSVRLPRGAVRLRAIAPGGREHTRDLLLEGERVELGPIPLGAAARVGLPSERTLRVVAVGTDVPDPRFDDDLLGFRLGERDIESSDVTNAASLAATSGDPVDLTLAPGSYRLYATRGIEHGIHQEAIQIAAGDIHAFDPPALGRLLETPGWIRADLHVHSAESFDSSLPLERQLVAFTAAGAEVVVATEHDRVYDPRPTLARLGLGDRIVGVVGVEATSSFPGGRSPHTAGHLNALPVPYQRTAYRGGAPDLEGRRLRELFAELRGWPTPPLTQLNHPRPWNAGYSDQAYFTHLAVPGEPFDPTQPLDAEPNAVLLEAQADGVRDIDFDAMELLNGPSMTRYLLTRADWFALLRQGFRPTATANSDSHAAGELPGIPTNYVELAADDVANFDEAAFVRALREGRAYGTTGPVLDVRLGDAGIGERHSGSEAVLHVGVRAADWVPVSELRVFVDGAPVHTEATHAGAEHELPLRFEGDAFVTVEVEGEAEGDYAALAPGFVPFAFTNPIYVDADGDGMWTAPGLAPIPATISNPLGE